MRVIYLFILKGKSPGTEITETFVFSHTHIHPTPFSSQSWLPCTFWQARRCLFGRCGLSLPRSESPAAMLPRGVLRGDRRGSRPGLRCPCPSRRFPHSPHRFAAATLRARSRYVLCVIYWGRHCWMRLGCPSRCPHGSPGAEAVKHSGLHMLTQLPSVTVSK